MSDKEPSLSETKANYHNGVYRNKTINRGYSKDGVDLSYQIVDSSNAFSIKSLYSRIENLQPLIDEAIPRKLVVGNYGSALIEHCVRHSIVPDDDIVADIKNSIKERMEAKHGKSRS